MVGSIKTTNLKDQTEMVACLHHLTVSMPIPELLYLFVKNRKCSYLKKLCTSYMSDMPGRLRSLQLLLCVCVCSVRL